MADPRIASSNHDRIVVVPGTTGLADRLRAGSIEAQLVVADSLLSGIIQAGEPGVRAIVVGLDDPPRRIDEAIAGLREAAGDDTRLVLCCPPHQEPLARRLLTAGASDYVIDPPTSDDVDRLLGREPAPASKDAAPGGATSPEIGELHGLADVLAHLDGALGETLGRMADLVEGALGAEQVQIVAHGHIARPEASIDEPEFTEPLHVGGEQVGQIVIGACRGDAPTTSIDRKLREYARVFSLLLEARHREYKARRRAITDKVSGLRNRRYLDERLAELVSRAEREQFRVTLLLFDIDNFKYYNDKYGHVAGDELIREVGQLMKRCCRSHDVVVRYGGDEFAVVFWDADQPRVAGSKHPRDPLSVVDRFRDALLNHRFATLGADERGKLTISGGLATFPWEARTVEDLILQADNALVAAKRQGKNRVLPIGGGWLTGDADARAAEHPWARELQTPSTDTTTKET